MGRGFTGTALVGGAGRGGGRGGADRGGEGRHGSGRRPNGWAWRQGQQGRRAARRMMQLAACLWFLRRVLRLWLA